MLNSALHKIEMIFSKQLEMTHNLINMKINLQLALWNANGLVNHIPELGTFLSKYNIDAILNSETHFTSRSHIKGYDLINSDHLEGKAHGGAGILIRSTIKYKIEEGILRPQLQATCVKVKCESYNITVYAVYYISHHDLL